MNDRLYIVGKITKYPAWEYQGVFSSVELAEKACRTNQYFVGPTLLNVVLPDETNDWTGCYYPLGDD